MSDAVRRAVLVAAVVLVIVGVALADAGRGGGQPVSSGSLVPGVLSASGIGVAPGKAESAAWFCPGATGTGGNAQSTLILTNSSPRPVTGSVTTTPVGAAPQATSVVVPAHIQMAVSPGTAVSGGSLASTVVFTGGGVGASQVVSGPLGYSVAPCASTTAAHWYFADGSTAQNNTLSLSLFNPTRTTAVVNVSFVSSTSGLLAPPAYQGIDVPGQSLVVENIGDHVRNQSDVATVVAALSGAVVAAETQSTGSPGNGGPSLILGAVKPAPMWTFAQNAEVTGASTLFHVFNPSRRAVHVVVRFGLQQGQAEPLKIRVPPLSVASIDPAGITRIPAAAPFSVTFVSTGAGIVVGRSVTSPGGAPAPQVGNVMGLPGGAERWLVPAPNVPAAGVSTVTVVNLGRAPTSVTLSAISASGLVPVPGLTHRRVRPGVPLIVTPSTGSAVGLMALELTSGAPVAVEVDASPAGNPGVVVIPGLPLP